MLAIKDITLNEARERVSRLEAEMATREIK